MQPDTVGDLARLESSADGGCLYVERALRDFDSSQPTLHLEDTMTMTTQLSPELQACLNA
ncbi:hypothetical protein [Deinococcus ruber]|uniref:hypothetical protein n=1 Tax=Deinococcus ruber TaxID=1848197 RepID=UPI00166C1F67|nr:hypothetical protein [Deinococcus ruber]